MKKIKEYQGDCLEFHKKVVESKHFRPKDPTYIERINALNSITEDQYKAHYDHFQKDDLASLTPKVLTIEQKNDLKGLYDYGTKPFQQLNDILTTSDNNTRQPICPFCTINNVNTFDHLIPKNEFSELSDHPVNLMPCCSQCNGMKSSNWRNGNVRKYLNLYIDHLPDVQYLFVKLSIEDDTIKANFFVDNRNNINNDLFLKISNHYTDLELCKRFALNCDNSISELKNTLISMNSIIEKHQLREIIKNTEKQNRLLYGFNYWKSILKIECCENREIFDFLFQEK